MSRRNIIPIFVPHMGCPHDCIFCNQKKISGYDTDISGEVVHHRILEYLSYFKKKNNIEVAFYGGSFTAMEEKTQEELLSVAFDLKKRNFIQKIRISTRPDAISERILMLLKKYGVDIIELGVQSLDREVLVATGRGHDDLCVYTSSHLIQKFDFSLGLQQMVGLPKDNYEKSLFTTEKFIELQPDFVRVYPTLVIKDTDLATKYFTKNYQPLTLEDSIPWISNLLLRYMQEGIKVIRIGLQATENIQIGKDVIAGPFHPSYGQLILNRLLTNGLIEYLKERDAYGKSIKIFCNGRELSNLVGQKSYGKQRIERTLELSQLKLYKEELPFYQIIVHIGQNSDKIDIRDYFIMEKVCI